MVDNKSAYQIIVNWFNALWLILDNGKVTRRITILWMLWITTEVFRWAMFFSETNPMSLNTAAILGAILTPLAGLHAAIFHFYLSSPVDKPDKILPLKDDFINGKT